MDSFEHLEQWYDELKASSESVSVLAVVGAKTDLASEAVVPHKVRAGKSVFAFDWTLFRL
jgi:hypothetical protein